MRLETRQSAWEMMRRTLSIRKTGVLDGEDDALDTEERAGAGEGGEPAVADDHVRVTVEGVAEEECQEGEELVQKGMHLLQGIQIQTDGGLAGGAERD